MFGDSLDGHTGYMAIDLFSFYKLRVTHPLCCIRFVANHPIFNHQACRYYLQVFGCHLQQYGPRLSAGGLHRMAFERRGEASARLGRVRLAGVKVTGISELVANALVLSDEKNRTHNLRMEPLPGSEQEGEGDAEGGSSDE